MDDLVSRQSVSAVGHDHWHGLGRSPFVDEIILASTESLMVPAGVGPPGRANQKEVRAPFSNPGFEVIQICCHSPTPSPSSSSGKRVWQTPSQVVQDVVRDVCNAEPHSGPRIAFETTQSTLQMIPFADLHVSLHDCTGYTTPPMRATASTCTPSGAITLSTAPVVDPSQDSPMSAPCLWRRGVVTRNSRPPPDMSPPCRGSIGAHMQR